MPWFADWWRAIAVLVSPREIIGVKGGRNVAWIATAALAIVHGDFGFKRRALGAVVDIANAKFFDLHFGLQLLWPACGPVSNLGRAAYFQRRIHTSVRTCVIFRL